MTGRFELPPAKTRALRHAVRLEWLTLAFLVTNRIRARKPDAKHPFGFHRSVSVGYLVAAAALLAMGTFLVESAVGLVLAERPPVGLVTSSGTRSGRAA